MTYGIDFLLQRWDQAVGRFVRSRPEISKKLSKRCKTAIKNTDDTNYHQMGMSKLAESTSCRCITNMWSDTNPGSETLTWSKYRESCMALNHPELKQIKELFFGGSRCFLTSSYEKGGVYTFSICESLWKSPKLNPIQAFRLRISGALI